MEPGRQAGSQAGGAHESFSFSLGFIECPLGILLLIIRFSLSLSLSLFVFFPFCCLLLLRALRSIWLFMSCHFFVAYSYMVFVLPALASLLFIDFFLMFANCLSFSILFFCKDCFELWAGLGNCRMVRYNNSWEGKVDKRKAQWNNITYFMSDFLKTHRSQLL